MRGKKDLLRRIVYRLRDRRSRASDRMLEGDDSSTIEVPLEEVAAAIDLVDLLDSELTKAEDRLAMRADLALFCNRPRRR